MCFDREGHSSVWSRRIAPTLACNRRSAIRSFIEPTSSRPTATWAWSHPRDIVARLARHGLVTSDIHKLESGAFHLRFYPKYFGIGYPERDAGIRRRIAAWRRLERHPVLMFGYEVAMGSYHRFVEQRTTALANAMFVAIRADKRAG